MGKITCQICGDLVHSVQLHLIKAHPEVSLETYRETYPGHPVLSDEAEEKIRERQMTRMIGAAPIINDDDDKVVQLSSSQRTAHLHDVFGLGKMKAARNIKGEGIPITVCGASENDHLVPEQDENYIWDIDVLKNLLLGIEINTPTYLYGHAGTGKTTVVEQMCHYTHRPFMRVQHTENMLETDVVGQWTVKAGETIFELGPLALAMKYGWLYLADEYDFAYPSILAIYQPVLEGKPLVIKEADRENRIIKPHPNFRFVATGNTNGTGDEHGLYSGTNIQNAANYSRFGMTIPVEYMSKRHETSVVQGQGGVTKEDAEMLIDWAQEIRKAFDSKKIGATVGPRELIHAAKIGSMKGSIIAGVQFAITNRMTPIDKEIAENLAQRFITF